MNRQTVVRTMVELILPEQAESLRALAAGVEVSLSGTVLTMRDAALKRLDELVREGSKSPFDLEGQVVFHAGPTPAASGRPAGAIGPTTSTRTGRNPVRRGRFTQS